MARKYLNQLTTMKNFSDQKIVQSWQKNAQPWVAAVRRGEIESRVLVTNNAILDAVLQRTPNTVLDVGCGEGWLVRELGKAGINTLGIDVVQALVDAATKAGGGRFKRLAFEELSPHVVHEKFDVMVANFSLMGNASVEHVFQQASLLLNPGGAFIVQTLHPVAGCGEGPYADGWRQGSWTGFSDHFSDPAPWYFRTLETWATLFQANGLRLNKLVEPLNPKTKNPASVIFTGVLAT